MSDFQEHCCSILENENTFATEMRNEVFFKFVSGSYYQNRSKLSMKESDFQNNSNESLFIYMSRIFIPVAKH